MDEGVDEKGHKETGRGGHGNVVGEIMVSRVCVCQNRELYTLNVCSLVFFNYVSIKLGKNLQKIKRTAF